MVILYTPGHRGISPNEYVDAIAKAHIGDVVYSDITADIAADVRSRPCIYEAVGRAMGLRNKRIYEEVKLSAAQWARQRVRGETGRSILLGGDKNSGGS